jgi:hypothetical protein
MTDEYSDPTYGYGELLGGDDAATADPAPASDPTYGYGELLGSDEAATAGTAPASDPTYGYGELLDSAGPGDTAPPEPAVGDVPAANDYGYGALLDADPQADTIDQTADAIVHAVDDAIDLPTEDASGGEDYGYGALFATDANPDAIDHMADQIVSAVENAVHLPPDDAPATDYGYTEVLANDAPPPDIALPAPLSSNPDDFATPTLTTLVLHGRDGGTTDPAAFLVNDGPVNFVTVAGADIASDGPGDIALPIDSRLINMHEPDGSPNVDDAALAKHALETLQEGQIPPEKNF